MRTPIVATLLLLLPTAITAIAADAPPITAATFSSDGKQVLLGSQQGVEIRSWPELKTASGPKTDLLHVHDLCFSPDGQMLLVAGGSPGEGGTVEIWDWPKRERLNRAELHSDVVYRAAWFPSGKEFVTASADGTCRIVTLEKLETRLTYSGHSRPVLSTSFSGDGKYIASVGVDQTLQFWDASSGELVRKFDNHLATINDVAVKTTTVEKPLVVATASEDRTVRFWQPTIGRLMRFARLPSAPRCIVWTPDGSHLLAGCNDGRVQTIDPDTAEVLSETPLLQGRVHVIALTQVGSAGIAAGENGQVQSIAPDRSPQNLPGP